MAIVALGGAVTAVAVANVALLDVAGGAQDQVGGLSSRIDLAPAPATAAQPASTTAILPAAPAAASTAATTTALAPALTVTTATTAPAATTPAPAPAATPPAPAPAATTTRADDHGRVERDRANEARENGDD